VRDDGALHREASRVLRFLLQERQRDQQRKRRVLVPGLLEAPVELALDLLPDRPAVRAHDHATADDVAGSASSAAAMTSLVPLRVVLRARRDGLLGHGCCALGRARRGSARRMPSARVGAASVRGPRRASQRARFQDSRAQARFGSLHPRHPTRQDDPDRHHARPDDGADPQDRSRCAQRAMFQRSTWVVAPRAASSRPTRWPRSARTTTCSTWPR
jgi:hypothetical protein